MRQNLLLILISFFFIANCKNAISKDLSLCKKGWDKHLAGSNNEAIKLFENCIKKGDLSNDSLARTYRNIGISYKDLGKYKLAINYYNKSLKLKPDDFWSDYVNRGNAWDLLGEYKKAFDDYDRAMEEKKVCNGSGIPKNIITIIHSPDCGEIFYNRGISYERQGKIKEAKEDFLMAYKMGLRTNKLHERFKYHKLFEQIKSQK